MSGPGHVCRRLAIMSADLLCQLPGCQMASEIALHELQGRITKVGTAWYCTEDVMLE